MSKNSLLKHKYVAHSFHCRAPWHLTTIQRKILIEENIDKFDEFPAIRQHQNFPFT